MNRARILGLTTALMISTAMVAEAQALRIQRTRNLRFRTVLAGIPTSVLRTNNRAGRVSIRGQRNAEITAQWVLPANIQHTTLGVDMPISFGTDDAGHGNRNNPSTHTGWDPATVLTVRLSNRGRKHFSLGGTVNPPTTQRAGNYRGAIALIVTYTGN